MERLTDAEIAELRALRHTCKGGLPPCECHVPEDLGDDGQTRNAPLPLLQRLLDELDFWRRSSAMVKNLEGGEAAALLPTAEWVGRLAVTDEDIRAARSAGIAKAMRLKDFVRVQVSQTVFRRLLASLEPGEALEVFD